ncbi:hypothetical protein [Sphaerisporangium sp. TRM90804]|uniref:hypothetical protein n=1 Tax=Sphaerisporangium sp. TRM90804 TaxID=3031113 RepID=UPI00244D1B4B|nr:hypothetical protein [Sphaerisporangium sp. TRM90804]MDH2424849.1 hypothetical protein [Sphaerisporangium sp. TRM90804]
MTTQIDMDALGVTLAEIRAYVENGEFDYLRHRDQFIIAGTAHDQVVPEGVSNPYWEIVRLLPSIDDRWMGDGITPTGYYAGLSVGRTKLVSTYSWSIPTPGDITWIAGVLNGRAVVEVGAGSGYWAWQLAQAGVDVVAYEPNDVTDNTFVEITEPYYPLLRDDASAAGKHPDRALLLSWPSYSDPWASHALSAYEGDLLLYVGEGESGCCADDAFFELLDAEWTEIGRSPHHVTWWGIHCRLIAYERTANRREEPAGGEAL